MPLSSANTRRSGSKERGGKGTNGSDRPQPPQFALEDVKDRAVLSGDVGAVSGSCEGRITVYKQLPLEEKEEAERKTTYGTCSTTQAEEAASHSLEVEEGEEQRHRCRSYR